MNDIKNTHGGPGRGQGRKSKYSEPLKNVTVAMTDTHRATIQKLGGLQVLRDWLDKQAKKLEKLDGYNKTI